VPERENIWDDGDSGALAARWCISDELARKLQFSANDYIAETRGTVQLISGHRTAQEQRNLGRAGRPAARDDLSTHRTCPATGADISLGFGTTRVQKAIWGRIVTMNGLRWGGGGRVDSGGIPFDWGHVDLGPRHQG